MTKFFSEPELEAHRIMRHFYGYQSMGMAQAIESDVKEILDLADRIRQVGEAGNTHPPLPKDVKNG